MKMQKGIRKGLFVISLLSCLVIATICLAQPEFDGTISWGGELWSFVRVTGHADWKYVNDSVHTRRWDALYHSAKNKTKTFSKYERKVHNPVGGGPRTEIQYRVEMRNGKKAYVRYTIYTYMCVECHHSYRQSTSVVLRYINE